MTENTQFNPPLPPEPPKAYLNKEVKAAVQTLITHYKIHNRFLDWEVLEDKEVDEILLGVKELIYKHEGIFKKQKK